MPLLRHSENLRPEHRGEAPGCPSEVAVVGGGPAGMTAALLLARAGHRVSIFETEDQLGGLWASRLDADGYFRGDNSCKVYQSTYHTAPALLRLIGTDWRRHFTPRHNLTTNWLRPFVADCSWRDLSILGGAYLAQRLGLRRYHHVSVAEFMEARGISEPCRRWMRATALGGIAGTLRMTMWELFHRLSSNVFDIFKDRAEPLYWNSQPPNSPMGFVSRWSDTLAELGVVVHLDTSIVSLDRRSGSRGVTLTTDIGLRRRADAVFLAVPPPALNSLLAASADPIAEGFGLRRSELGPYFEDSVYEHLGIAWFFDRELPNGLPLGGNNVRRGWHSILVEHSQYRAQLEQPAVSVVIGSVAVDTDFLHHRLGTRTEAHTHAEIAAILWQDERLVDSSLPEPIDCELMGLTSATQIVRRGPLPVAMAEGDVFLATNMHGRAPYFTASLESAMQAGALSAERFDPSVERLPMGREARKRLPWTPADRTRRPAAVAARTVRNWNDERRIELSTDLPASADEAWRVFLDIDEWSVWGRLVTAVRGKLVAGSKWTMELRAHNGGAPRRMTPRLIELRPPRGLQFETVIGGAWAVKMIHAFVVEPLGVDKSVLRQSFDVTGLLVAPLWRPLRRGMVQFEELGADLARHLAIAADLDKQPNRSTVPRASPTGR